ncbi:MAG: TlpA disulfide reductase family protein [Rhizobiaceae bacterium]
MNEDHSPDKNVASNPSLKTAKLAMLAGVLGLAVGAGLYAFSDRVGNDQNTGPLASASCAVDESLRAKLDNNSGGHVAAFKALDRPVSVAELGFTDLNGQEKSLGDWSGRTVLFNLWATWCAPCRAEMPALDQLQADLGSDQFEVVLVSVDLGSDEKPKKFYKDVGMQHARFFHDADLSTLNVLKKEGLAFGLPATLLVNGKGCVIGALSGPAEWASDDAKKLIETAL